MLMNRILRNYLEEVMLTPTELLHGYRDLQRFKDYENLFPSAVSHIATLQTAGGGQSPLERRNEIYAICEQIAERTRRADAVDPPKLGELFSKTLARVGGTKGESAEYLAMAVLARELGGTRNWVGKLDRLCRLAAAETEPKATLLRDTVIAAVRGANVVPE
ncbi:MAG: hypothetical protein VW338_19250, partial [Rhodospirillaceae bacterium]